MLHHMLRAAAGNRGGIPVADLVAHYEPLPDNLFQDSSATIAVTSDGDPVGYMADLSGNGCHAIQATSGSRPIYRTNGTLHWLETDGVYHRMDISSLPLESDISCFFSIENATQTGEDSIHRPLLAGNGDDTYEPNGKKYGLGLARSGSDSIRMVLADGQSIQEIDYAISADGLNNVILFKKEGSSANIILNGASVASGTLGRISGFTATGYQLFTNFDNRLNRSYKGKFYGAAFYSRAVTVNEIDAVNTHLGDLAGISI